MRTVLSRTGGVLVVALITVVGLVALADATKFEGQVAVDGATRVEFRVDTKNYPHDDDAAAASLWYACIGTVSWEESTPPRGLDDGNHVATLRPSLGEDSRRRFRGCLEDGTVDRVRGNVVAMTQRPEAAVR